MPLRDGRGPMWRGPRTGLGLGNCASTDEFQESFENNKNEDWEEYLEEEEEEENYEEENEEEWGDEENNEDEDEYYEGREYIRSYDFNETKDPWNQPEILPATTGGTSMTKHAIIQRLNRCTPFHVVRPQSTVTEETASMPIEIALESIVKSHGLEPGKDCMVLDYTVTPDAIKVIFQKGKFGVEQLVSSKIAALFTDGEANTPFGD